MMVSPILPNQMLWEVPLRFYISSSCFDKSSAYTVAAALQDESHRREPPLAWYGMVAVYFWENLRGIQGDTLLST